MGSATILGLCLLVASGIAQDLSDVEKKIVADVDLENPRALDLIRNLVEINSGTMNLDGVRAVGRTLEPEFSALGFEVRWVPMDRVARGGTLVAKHACAKPQACGKRMLLIGHMDTVFEKDSPFQAYAVAGTVGTGPGVSDMKGGLVVMLYALKAMQAADALKNADITVILSGDEERPGEPLSVARKDLLNAAEHKDVALEFEPAVTVSGEIYASTSRRSYHTWRLEATGETGHSSAIFSPEKGYGAIYELTRVLDEFRTQLPETYLTLNVGLVLGGTTLQLDENESKGSTSAKTNVIAPLAVAMGDIRTLSDEQTRRIQDRMQAIVAQHLAKTNAKISFAEGYPAMPPTPGNRGLLAMLNHVNRSLGQADMRDLDPIKRGAGDISFVASGLDCLTGLGAVGAGAHEPGETIDLSSQPLQTKRAALLMYRLTQIDERSKLTE